MSKIFAIWGVANMGWAALSLLWSGSAGIPDGYVSPYDRMTAAPLAVISWTILFTGLVMLVRGMVGRMGRWDLLMAWCTVLALYVPSAVIEACPRWSFCSSVLQSTFGSLPDDGIGG